MGTPAASKTWSRARCAAAVLGFTVGVVGAVTVGPAGLASASSKQTMPGMSAGKMAKMPGMSATDMAKMKVASAKAAKAVPKPATTIVIKNFSFSPGAIMVTPGERVKVVNRDSVAHTVTSSAHKFDTGNIAPGKSAVFTAPQKAGTYPYYCNIHQYMTGKLVVMNMASSHGHHRKARH